jgi:tetratricopeptide (TPR) repeat protein
LYTVHQPRRKSGASAPKVAQRNRLDLGFFQRLFTPGAERALVDGLKSLNAGDLAEALSAFEEAVKLPDAAWMAGMLRLRREDFGPARQHLEAALRGLDDLGGLFAKYAIETQATIQITPEVDAHVQPCERGTRLALLEIAQREGQRAEALREVSRLLAIVPDDPVVLVSFAELVLEGGAATAELERIVALTTAAENTTPIETALLLYRGRALAELKLPDAAIDVFTLALRRRKDRSDGLLRHRCHILETGNDSYRFKASSETAKKKRKETAALTPS